MVKDGLFNRDAGGLPLQFLQTVCREYQLRYTWHARNAAANDRYGAIRLPDRVIVEIDKIVECEIAGGRVKKFLVRVPYTPGRDMCLVLVDPDMPSPGVSDVKTVWINRQKDQHKTLRRAAYASYVSR